MTNLEIIKSTYEGKTSEENGKNLAKYVAENISWTEAKDYIANEDKVVAYGTYSGTYKKTNKYFGARVAHIWKLNNGKIISFEQFVDSKSVDEAIR